MQSVVEQSGVDSGLVSVFVPGSTAAVTTMEHEPGGVHDLREALGGLIPQDADYELGGDPPTSGLRPDYPPGGDRGPSETIPARSDRLELGTWQQIVLIDFDERPRTRDIVVKAFESSS